MFDQHDDENRRSPYTNNPYRQEIDSMWWASSVIVEQEDGKVVTINGVSTSYEQASREQEAVLRTIRMINPDARIVDAYYISRAR